MAVSIEDPQEFMVFLFQLLIISAALFISKNRINANHGNHNSINSGRLEEIHRNNSGNSKNVAHYNISVTQTKVYQLPTFQNKTIDINNAASIYKDLNTHENLQTDYNITNVQEVPHPSSNETNIHTRPLSFLNEKLLESYKECQINLQDLNETVKQFSKEHTTILKETNEIEKLKLQFKIAKYKFENPTFSLNDM